MKQELFLERNKDLIDNIEKTKYLYKVTHKDGKITYVGANHLFSSLKSLNKHLEYIRGK